MCPLRIAAYRNVQKSMLHYHYEGTIISVNSIINTITNNTPYTFFRQQQKRFGHTVRVIVTKDYPDGMIYKNDIIAVKAGYARNFLLPHKYAIYATRDNFNKLNMKDPNLETVEERKERIQREAQAGADQDLRAADLLKNYLKNKVLKIWRNVDRNSIQVGVLSPGMVDAKAVRQKLSKQLKIDLESHETVHLYKEPIIHDEITDDEIDIIMNEQLSDDKIPCTTKIRQLGEYIARISLRGGYKIPLKVVVMKR